MILRFLALVAFTVAAVICLVVDAPDTFDVLAAVSIGLACWVGDTLAGGRP